MPYPSIITTYSNPQPTDKLNSPSHSGVEIAQNTSLTEIETFVGTIASTAGTLIYDIRSANSNGGGHIQSANKGGTGQISYNKGDLLVATSSSVISKLAVGTDGKAIVADSSQSAGLSYQTVLTAPVIQNQTATYARGSVISTSVYAAQITPIPSALSDGQAFQIKWPVTNTTSILAISISSIVAARIKNPDGTNPAVGSLKASTIGILEFDSVGSIFQIANTSDAENLTGTLPSVMTSSFLSNAYQEYIFPVSSVWVCPRGISSILVDMVAGGGGGGGGTSGQVGGGGGGGGGDAFLNISMGVTPITSLLVTVGTGGTGAGGQGSTGGTGGTTSLNGVSVLGGFGGVGTNGSLGGAGGAGRGVGGVGGNGGSNGGAGATGSIATGGTGSGGTGGAPVSGNSGGGGGGAGGIGSFGGAGGSNGGVAVAGNIGSFGGGGGGGGNNNGTGGGAAGGSGLVIIKVPLSQML